MARIDCSPLLKVPGEKGVWHFFARSPGFGGDAWCHLIPGTERALLIDTGFGIGDLRRLCAECTDLPLLVVNTHNHGDHTMGNDQFDRVYIHRLDVEGLRAQMKPGPRTVEPVGGVTFYEENDIVQPKNYEISPIEDGHVFDLGGGYEVEVFHLPGHSPGGIALLDRKRRMLFSGDALVFTPIFIFGVFPGMKLTPYHSVEAFRDGLKKLAARLGEFDAVFPGHSHQGLDPSIVTDMLACAEELLAGDTSAQQSLHFGPMTAKIHIHGKAKIAFSDDRIHACK